MENVKTNNKPYIAVIVALALVIVGLGIALYFNSQSMSGHANNLESVYQKSLYELIDNVNSMEVEVSKLLVTNDSKSTKNSITTIKQQSADAQNSLSYLPISSSFVNSASRFINQLNGFSTSLLKGENVILTESQSNTWAQIYDCIANLKYELNKLSLKISQGYSIIDNLDNTKDIDGFSQNFSSISSDSIEYPSMIYDGPFSESVMNKEIKGLSSDKCTDEQAKAYLQKLFVGYDIIYQGKTEGKFITFNYTVQNDKLNYYAQVTEMGKFLLSLSSSLADGDSSSSREDAINLAVDFAKKCEIENMQSVWEYEKDNVCYINLAPVINGVIYYPDLIKVKVNLNGLTIVGWEASNYAYNHIERSKEEFKITQSQVLNNVSKKISVISVKKCLIPLEYVGESIAYEVCGKYNGFTYYLYFDGITGEQIKVLRVIQTADGELLL